MEIIEIPFGAKDSELQEWTYTIPDGMEAEIRDGKVIIKKKESEDERIRKELYAVINDLVLPDEQRERFNAYLEKQKEQKPAEWNDRDYHWEGLVQLLRDYQQTIDRSSNNMAYESVECYIKWIKSLCSSQKQEWSEEDKHRCKDAIYFLETAKKHYASTSEIELTIEWLKSLQPQARQEQKEQKPLEYLPKKKINDILGKLTDLSYSKLIPFKSRESQKIDEISTDILGLLDYPIEQKPVEWSEEDEKMRKSIIQVLKSFVSQADCESNPSLSASYPTYFKEIDWFESLSPQSKKELFIEKAIKWLDDTFYFLDNSSGRGRDCEITTHEFDSLKEMYDSFRKAVIVDSESYWKPIEEQKPEAKLTGWVARDNENNSYFGFGLFLFSEKPERTGDCWSGAITSHLPWKLFPDLKWNDEPMEVEVTIRKK